MGVGDKRDKDNLSSLQGIFSAKKIDRIDTRNPIGVCSRNCKTALCNATKKRERKAEELLNCSGMTTNMKKFRVLLFSILVLLVVMLYIAVYQKHVNQVTIAVPVKAPRPVGVHQLVPPKLELSSVKPQRGRVHVCIFTGRWKYLRILLPYLYRELRQNGGVVDRVIFAMIGYEVETQTKLKNFSTTANSVLKDEAFQFVYFKHDPLTKRMNLVPFYAKFH